MINHQAGLDQAERLLLAPTAENVDAVCGLLREAAASGGLPRGSLAGAALGRIAALLESARETREGHWRLRLGSPGYTSAGTQQAYSPAARMKVEA